MNSHLLRARETGRDGNALAFVILVLGVLMTFCAGHFMVAQKQQQQAAFFSTRSDLYQYAETGLALSIHDVKNNASGKRGMIGTESWSVFCDVGRDGIPGTLDEGEADGIPTPGEPSLAPVPIGPAELGAGLLVSVYPTPWAGVFLLVSTCVTPDTYVTVERVYRASIVSIPAEAAITVPPDVRILIGDSPGGGDAGRPLRGLKKPTAFVIDGRDHGLDLKLAEGEGKYGIVTKQGEPAGSNRSDILLQVPYEAQAQILGKDGPPSIEESESADLEMVFVLLKSSATRSLEPGTHENLILGGSVPDLLPVAYANGDLEITGTSSGAGALVVEGSLKVSGTFSFQGLVVVKGDVSLYGDKGGIHVVGALMADGSFVAIGGATEVLYSSTVLNDLQQVVSRSRAYVPIYYNER